MKQQKRKIIMRDGISMLIRKLGITQISGRRLGHYNLTNLDELPEDKLPMIYEDLFKIYERIRRVA